MPADLSALEFTLPCRVHYRARSRPVGSLVYAALVTLAGSDGRIPEPELGKVLGREGRSVRAVCGACTRALRAVGHPGRVRLDGGDVVVTAAGG